MSDHWKNHLSEYLDGDLSDGERVALEAHLQTCGECSELLSQLEAVVSRARALGDLEPTRDLSPGR